MDQVRQETSDGQSGRLHKWLIAVVMFLMVYVLLPQVLVYPVYRYYHGMYTDRAGKIIDAVFYPDITLARACPPYRWLLHWEGWMLGMNRTSP